jgi:hypothetical protein
MSGLTKGDAAFLEPPLRYYPAWGVHQRPDSRFVGSALGYNGPHPVLTFSLARAAVLRPRIATRKRMNNLRFGPLVTSHEVQCVGQ